jgi:hypothetical protein
VTQVTLRELVEELERDPNSTELVDLVQLLDRAGYVRREGDAGLVLFVHAGWRSRWTLDSTRRYIPVSIVLDITATIRTHATAEGRL